MLKIKKLKNKEKSLKTFLDKDEIKSQRKTHNNADFFLHQETKTVFYDRTVTTT